jgi:hypothetical protein
MGRGFEMGSISSDVCGPSKPPKACIDDFDVSTLILENNLIIVTRWE